MTAAPLTGGGTGHGSVAKRAGCPVLVVAVDGSSSSWDAFAWTAGEAHRGGGEIIAVFISPLAGPSAGMAVTGPLGSAAFNEAHDEIARTLATDIGRRAAELGVEVRFVHERGDPVQVLTRVTRAVQADVIALGRSAKPLHRLAGSLSRRLVLNRDLPVIVVVP